MLTRSFLGTLSILLLTQVPAGCAREAVDENSTERTLEVTGVVTADAAWNIVTAGAPDVQQRPGEQDFEHYMRNIQLDLIWLREKGLEFWHAHPDDPRRYMWLVATTNLPPAYAVDIDEWAANEAKIGPNRAEIHLDALKQWDEEIYPALKADLFALPSSLRNTKLQRRLLVGEIVNGIKTSMSLSARGEPARPIEMFLDDFVEMAALIPEAFDESDSRNHVSDFWYVYNVFFQSDVYGFTPERAEAFIEMLEPTGVFLAAVLERQMQNRGHVTTGNLRMGRTENALRSILGQEGSWDWRILANNPPQGALLNLIRHSYLPSQSQGGSNNIDRMTWIFHNSTPSLRRQVLVDRYWEDMTLSEQANALLWTCDYPVSYYRNPLRYSFSEDLNLWPFRDPHGADLDTDASHRTRLNARIDHLFERAGELTPEERDLAALGLLNCETGSVLYEWPVHQDKQKLFDHVEFVRKSYERAEGGAFTSRSIANFIQRLSRAESRELYGLTDTELQTMFSPFIETESAELRGAIEGLFNRTTLGSDAPVEIQAPTLDGELVNTADLKGKIVLIDHWDTQCAPCIAAMPAIHETYLEYKDKGFEVVSIAYDATRNRRRVDRLKSEMGLTWDTLNGEGLWAGIATTYDLSGFPSYMLLDREGRWVAGNDQLRNTDNLPVLLDAMLAEEDDG